MGKICAIGALCSGCGKQPVPGILQLYVVFLQFKLNACICMSTNKNDYYHLGLTDNEVLQSREKNGINLLTPPKRPSLWKLYLEKFEDPVVRVLLVAAAFSLIISIIENEYTTRP